MKHPFKIICLTLLILTAVAAAILMTMRYLDVLQKQFDFLRGLLARRGSGVPVAHDSDFGEDFEDEDDDSFSADEEYSEYNDDDGDLKF